jgi:uncharacterized protein (TIGR02246 family)
MFWDSRMNTTSVNLASSDLDDIQALIDGVAAGITLRDPDRCVARFASEARSVIATGIRSVGRDAIREAHVAAFASGSAPGSARFVVLDLYAPRPDLAIATTGAYAAGPDDEVDLDHPRTIVTWTLAREADGWWVVARQFTPVA